MTPTPERALELAEHSEKLQRLAAQAKNDTGNTEWLEIERRHSDIAAILRAYADIAPKWQAVLDAEPVAAITRIDGRYDAYPLIYNDQRHLCEEGRHLLIIKPTP